MVGEKQIAEVGKQATSFVKKNKWLIIVGGIGLAALGGFIIYEIFKGGSGGSIVSNPTQGGATQNPGNTNVTPVTSSQTGSTVTTNPTFGSPYTYSPAFTGQSPSISASGVSGIVIQPAYTISYSNNEPVTYSSEENVSPTFAPSYSSTVSDVVTNANKYATNYQYQTTTNTSNNASTSGLVNLGTSQQAGGLSSPINDVLGAIGTITHW